MSKINKQMASLVSPRPQMASLTCVTRGARRPRRKGVGGCRRLHCAPHVKLWEHQRPPRACRSAAACGVTITSPVNQLHPGVKEAPTSKGQGMGQGTLQAAREAGRVWVRWGVCAGHSQGRCPHQPQVSLIPPLAAQDQCLVSRWRVPQGPPEGSARSGETL